MEVLKSLDLIDSTELFYRGFGKNLEGRHTQSWPGWKHFDNMYMLVVVDVMANIRKLQFYFKV